jgi:hypothetical protein
LTDAIVKVVGHPDGHIDLIPEDGADGLAIYLSRILNKDADMAKSATKTAAKSAASKAANAARSGSLAKAAAKQPVPSQAEIERLVKAEFERQGMTSAVKEAQERAEKAAALEKQAADWRELANVHWGNLDPGVRESYLAKAADNEKAAQRLKSPAGDLKGDLAKSTRLEAEADAYAAKATDEPAGDLRRHFTEKALELRDQAALARGDGDNITATNHAAAAEEYRQRALKADTAEARSYFYDKQREFLARAAIARSGDNRRL